MPYAALRAERSNEHGHVRRRPRQRRRFRFELEADGVIAFMNYRRAGDTISLDHMETPVAARGRGLASRLVAGALDQIRARGLKIVPRCPFVPAFFDRHPDYRDLAA